MAIFNNENILDDAGLESATEQVLEEGNVLAEFADLGELVLEGLPDVVRLLAVSLLRSQQDLVAQHFVELLWV